MSERDQFGRARRTSGVSVTMRGVVGALIVAVLGALLAGSVRSLWGYLRASGSTS
jgi:hypothetical protein